MSLPRDPAWRTRFADRVPRGSPTSKTNRYYLLESTVNGFLDVFWTRARLDAEYAGFRSDALQTVGLYLMKHRLCEAPGRIRENATPLSAATVSDPTV